MEDVIKKINEILIHLGNLNNKVDNVNNKVDKAEQTSLSANRTFEVKHEEFSNKMVILEAGVLSVYNGKYY
jgi:hypothetical protein